MLWRIVDDVEGAVQKIGGKMQDIDAVRKLDGSDIERGQLRPLGSHQQAGCLKIIEM
jgi:hypothetical protein